MSKYLVPGQTERSEIPDKIETVDQFQHLGVELFKEIGEIIINFSTATPHDPETGKELGYSREEAAMVGQLVRYGKLCTAFLEQYVKGRVETSLIMLRSLTETYVNLMYFLKYSDKHTIRHFIKNSLRTEQQLLDILRTNTEDKQEIEVIEKRMMETIHRAFEDADFERDEVNNSSKWDSKIKARMSDILGPQAYALVYGTSSHAVHGNWQDLMFYHLIKKDDKYYPYCDWNEPRLQIISWATISSCQLLIEYAKRVLPPNKDREELIQTVMNILNRSMKLDAQHEKFIQ